MKTFKYTIIIAVLYVLFGRLALFLALPPGYASPIWPAAGIALAFMIRYGYRIWPGIVLGSFLVNIWTSLDTSSTQVIIKSVTLALSIGVGASLQAIAGRYLVKRFVAEEINLVNINEVGKTMLWGGVVGCMVSPCVGVVSLISHGIIPLAGSHISWATWWVGDVIGVLLFFPITLAWISGSREVWVKRRLSLTLPLIVIFAVIMCIFYFGYEAEKNKIKTVFKNEALSLSKAIEYKVEEFYIVLDSVESFYNSSQFVSRDEFSSFLQGVGQKMPEIKSVAWAPRMTPTEIPKYVELAAQDGIKNYTIKEVGPDGKLQQAADREVYYPLYYIEPQEGNEVALGIDNGSEPDRLKTILDARDLGLARAAAPVILGQDAKEGLQSLLLIMPVYKKNVPLDTIDQRRDNIRGFVTATSRIQDIFQGAMRIADFSQDIQVAVYDVKSSLEKSAYVSNQTNAPAFSDQFKEDLYVDVAGRTWRLHFQPTLNFIVHRQTWTLWLVLVGTLLLSSMFNALVLFITGQTMEISRLVDMRTEELNISKRQLEEQIELKDKTENELIAQAKKLEDQQEAMLNVLEDAESARKETEKANVLLKKLKEQLEEMNQGLEEKVAERTKELVEAQEKLIRQEKLAGMGKLAGIIGHEIRGPLGVIRNSAYFLKMKLKDHQEEKILKHLNILDEEVNTANRIIEDTLDFARVKEPNLSATDVDALIKISLGRKKIPGYIKLIHKKIDPLAFIKVDILQMQRVYYNLIWNAIQSMPEKGTLTISSAINKGYVETVIADTGCGILEEELKKIFEPLYTTKTKGTGLGLSVCQSIVENHAGSLIVNSQVDKGTQFTVRLPLLKKEQ